MVNGLGKHAFDLPPELVGTVEIVAYRVGTNGMRNVKKRVVYVRTPRQIEITTNMDKAEYRPGDSGKLQFQLRDQNGKPTPGALSLAAVDEAVFAMVGQTAAGEGDFYTLDRNLLRPVLQLYPWSPVAGKEKDMRLLEQALFATTCSQPARDREALISALLPYVENNRRVFDVLEYPKLDNLIDNSWVPKEALDILRNTGCATWPVRNELSR